MNLDMSDAKHREALKWACRHAFDPLLALQEPVGPTHSMSAVASIGSPADSAALVRALGEVVGCRVAITRLLDGQFVYFSDGTARGVVERVRDSDLPALVLRLLACTTAAEALAALREHGR